MDYSEMQALLDLCVEDGKSELKTYRVFLKFLGLKYNGKRGKSKEENKNDED